MNSSLPRRDFLARTTLAATTLGWVANRVSAAAAKRLHLSTNAYSWHVFYQREGRNFGENLEQGLADVKASGHDGYEPSIGGPDDVRRLAPALKKNGIELRSVYVNSTLHTEEEAEKSIAAILDSARAARELGTRIVVTNPNPIQWGGKQAKSDQHLRTQAASMNKLGRALKDLGITLAYHNHDIELRQAAREFHHMMNGTDPALVSLCLDAHWIFRGSENSYLALLDVAKLYGSRVAELHLRQSKDGVWSETLGPGDIDYPEIVQVLSAQRATPHLVMEIAVENGTPKTLSPVEAHRQSAAYAQEVFGPLASRA